MTVVESLPLLDAVLLVAPNDSILFWSRSAEALFGYSSAEIAGSDIHQLFDEWPAKSPIAEARRKDGSSFLAEVTCETVEVASVVTVRDMWGDEALETIDELENVGTYERDLVTGAMRWSSEVFDIYDLPRDSVDIDELKRRIVDEDRPRVASAVEESIRTHAPLRIRYRIHRGSETRTLFATGKFVVDEAGRAVRLYGSVRDVSQTAAHDDDVTRRITATMAHELNNVMMGILTFVEVLKRRRDEASIDRVVHEIAKGVKQGTSITDAIVRYARGSQPVMSTIDVASWLARFASDEVTVESEPGLSIRGDVAQLNQALANLLANARAASPSNAPIEIRARRESSELAEIVVTDHGSGIGPELLERIFEPLFTTRRRAVGMGLAIVRQVVEAHGGSVSVRSELGAGSEFHLHLPV